MKLYEYIEKVGDATAGEQFGVEARTAKSWRLGYRTPRPEKAREIAAITKGKVSFAECYDKKQHVA